MANKIIIKNGAGAPPADALSVAEFGFDTTNKKLYIGHTDGPIEMGPPDLKLDLSNSMNGNPNGVNADTLEGKTIDEFVLKDELKGLIDINPDELVYVSEELQETATVPLNADTLGGHPVEDFIRPKAGFIYPLAGSVVPEGFLLCDGAAYSRTDFPELFAAIGTVYGSGDGSTTFNVPNLQTRVPIGAGGEFSLGATGGEATHTLTVDEMPRHNHMQYVGANSGSWGVRLDYNSDTQVDKYPQGSTGHTGGSQPHNNMQPYTVVNYIIATGKDTGVSVSDIIMGAQALPLEVKYGGTGVATLKDARHNLGVNARNLLDNSDFTNPVNQRGQTSHAAIGYTIDRWLKGNEHGTVTVNNKHITLQGGSSSACWFQQKIPHGDSLVGKTLTFAVMDSNGELIIGSKTISNSNSSEFVRKNWGFLFFNAVANDALLVSIVVNVGYTKSFVWAALYEGEYTAETLPEYQPKGYGVELAECKRYYEVINDGCSQFISPYNTSYTAITLTYSEKRIIPTITFGTLTNAISVAGVGTLTPTSIAAANPIGRKSARVNIGGSYDTTKTVALHYDICNAYISADL